MGCDRVIVAGASTDNTVLWTSADAVQNRYALTVVDDCTMVHREGDHPDMHECALQIIRKVLHGEVISLDDVIGKYLRQSRSSTEPGA
jgi:nicotinamidase-related amidase